MHYKEVKAILSPPMAGRRKEEIKLTIEKRIKTLEAKR